MTTEVLAQSLSAGVQATFGAGRVWYLKTASTPVTITCEDAGGSSRVRKFSNVGAGFKFKADVGDGWTYLRIISAAAQPIELVIGDDDVEIANAVSVTGTVSVTPPAVGFATRDTPGTAINSPADIALAAASSDTASIPQNLARRRITIGVTQASAGAVRLSSSGATGRGVEVQPGNFIEFDTTAAIGVRNDGAAATAYYYVEET